MFPHMQSADNMITTILVLIGLMILVASLAKTIASVKIKSIDLALRTLEVNRERALLSNGFDLEGNFIGLRPASDEQVV